MPSPVLHTSVLDTLGRRIASGELREGAVLTLDAIGGEFGVSRTVAREAMRMLENLGLVRSRRRVGIVVLGMADWHVLSPRVIAWRLQGAGRGAQLRTLTELRHAVEPLAAAGAARHAPPEVRAELVTIAKRMRELGEAGEGDHDEFLELDVRLHELLLSASGNELFGALSGVVAAVLSGRTSLGLMPASPVPAALDAHEAVARAVADGDSDAAQRAMATIVDEVQDALVDVDAALAADPS
ncbi:FadR family transcriptional regulator [Xylanimonas allomyrinae]|uniref:FadR family transcriptional regulator n=1 Tax=Xylanimonas allomyrinae TaxID=2509459 RepID=A0A4P6ENT2_9MICO|nr:FCD domain-containing protein [Xylanimonas allomyrinae]QAY64096.1 FadR family transcriptional regulator [Xylanimonas allomyrinae]